MYQRAILAFALLLPLPLPLALGLTPTLKAANLTGGDIFICPN